MAESPEIGEETGNADETDVIVDVADEDVPLANFETEQQKMSWWWLLIVLLLGVTGEEMYRRHRRKLAEADRRDN